MMPGESHSQTAGIASDATAGTCQNCNALQQNLNEYVAALLALKQKIIDTDHLLTEYQEKCDELQKAQRETSTLHHQLDELLLKLVPLEKQNKEFEEMKLELDEKRSSLKLYQQSFLEVETLKEDRSKTEALKKKLESQVKRLEDITEKQSCEIKQLKLERKTVEKDLQKTQKKLDKLEKDNQRRELRNSSTQTNATQETAPILDKTKVRLLLEELWMCIEPSSQVSQTHREQLQFSDEMRHPRMPSESPSFAPTVLLNSPLKREAHNNQPLLYKSPSRRSVEPSRFPIIPFISSGAPEQTLTVPEAAVTRHRKAKRKEKRRRMELFTGETALNGAEQELTVHENLNERLGQPSGDEREHSPLPGHDLDQLLEWFTPLPPLLSPVHFSPPHTEESLFGNMSDSSAEDEVGPLNSAVKDILVSESPHLKDVKDALQSDIPCDKVESELEDSSELASTQTVDRFLCNGSGTSSSVPQNRHEPDPSISVDMVQDGLTTSTHKTDTSNAVSPESLHNHENSDGITSSHIAQETECAVNLPPKEAPPPQSVLGSEETSKTLIPTRSDEEMLDVSRDPLSDDPVQEPVVNEVTEELPTPMAEVSEVESSNAEQEEVEQVKTDGNVMDTECSPCQEHVSPDENKAEDDTDVKSDSCQLDTAEEKTKPTDPQVDMDSNSDSAGGCNALQMLFQTPPANVNVIKEEMEVMDSPVQSCMEQETNATEQVSIQNVQSETQNVIPAEEVMLEEVSEAGSKDIAHLGTADSNHSEESQKEDRSETIVEESSAQELEVCTGISDSAAMDIKVSHNDSSLPEDEDELEQAKGKENVDVIGSSSVPQTPEESKAAFEQNMISLIESSDGEQNTIEVKDLGDTDSESHGIERDSDTKLSELKEKTEEKPDETPSNNSSSLEVKAQVSSATDSMSLDSISSSVEKTSSVQNAHELKSDGNDSTAVNQNSSSVKPCDTKPESDLVEEKFRGENQREDIHSKDSVKDDDSSDEQESFTVQRKVKPINQRVGSINNDLQKLVSVGRMQSEVNQGKTPVEDNETEVNVKTPGTPLINSDEMEMPNKLKEVHPEKEFKECITSSLEDVPHQSEKTITEMDNLSSTTLRSLSEPGLEAERDSQHRHRDEASNGKVLCEEPEVLCNDEAVTTRKNLARTTPGACRRGAAKTKTLKDDILPGTVLGRLKAGLKGRESVTMNPPVLACADTSTSTKSSSESIKKVRSAMGPPLPPLLPPLTATPPRLQRLASPLRLRSCRLSFPSPMDELVSPSDGPKKNSPCFATPSPSDSKSGTVSPLQFCAATPKHALPVPGRLPPSALTSSTSSPTMQQENSVRILDTMYPELSARARTLNILRGNVHLNRSIPGAANHVPGSVNQISGFKAINSSTTAFTKTGKACELENSSLKQQSESTPVIRKRPGVNMLLPRSAKKLRLDMDSPVPEKMEEPVTSPENSSELSEGRMQKQGLTPTEKHLPSRNVAGNFPPKVIVNAFKKIEKACFDLLPVIKSHLKAGNVSRVPVLRDEERDVIKKFCSINKFKHLAEEFLIAILSKMKSEKLVLHSNHLQALCRVYVGICRQQGDLEKARLFAYSILKEDFPDSAKMVLFVISTWYNIFSFPGLINKAIQAVTRHRAKGDVLQCLTTYLDWEKAPPGDIVRLLSNTMIVLQMGVNMTFQYHDRHGEDLSPGVWEYIFALDLLCSQQHWDWTHDHFICKELWPIMDKWLKQGKRVTQHTTDISVAAVLRLIGRLGQLGMRERSVTSVKNVASVINKFGQHANAEGVPWAVQLAAVYAIYDLAPSNPKEALEALAAWRAETSHPVPPAVTSCITQIGSMCRQIR